MDKIAVVAALGGPQAKAVSTKAGQVASVVPFTAPSAPFHQCPAVGLDTSCALLIEVTDTTVNLFGDPTQGPFDGTDDTLVGVVNDSSNALSSLTITSPNPIFGFDGDGLCTMSPRPTGCPFGPTTYEGPGTSFVIGSSTNGTVNIPLAARGSGYFSLEEVISTGTITATGAGQLPPVGGPVSLPEGQVWNPAQLCVCGVSGTYTRKPVITPWGNFTHSFTDISIPDRGPDLGFSRTYSSYPNSTVPNGPLGYGWSEPYAMKIAVTGTSPNQVATVTQEDGAQVAFNQSGSSWVPAAPRTIATLTSSGTTFTFTRRAREVFTFDSASGHLNSIADLNGNTLTVPYFGPFALGVTDGSGRTLSFGYDGSGRINSVTDLTGRRATFTYDTNGNLSTSVEPDGATWSFTYDASHRLLTMLDPNQQGAGFPVPVTNHYDTQGRVDRQTDEDGRLTTFGYALDAPSQNGTVTITDPNGYVTQEQYATGYKTSVTTGFGTAQAATTSYAYDPTTLLPTTIVDPNLNTTTNMYDARGNVLTTTDALNRTTTSTFNALNEPLTVKDPTLVATTNTYDSAGNLLSSSRPCTNSGVSCGTQSTTYHHDEPTHPGDVTSMTDPRAKTWTYTYDADGNRISATDPLGNKTTYTYDRLGRQVSTVSPKGNVSGASPDNFRFAVVRDAMNRQLQTIDALGTPDVDQFNRANSATSLGTGDTGHGYLTLGTWGISSGAAYLATASGTTNLAITGGTADGTVAATMTGTQTGMGVVFHYQDTNNFWSLRANATANRWDLYKRIAGTDTLSASTGANTCCTNSHVIVATSGSVILVYVGTSPQILISDSALATNSIVGMLTPGVGTGRLDDLVQYAGGTAHPAVTTSTYDANGNPTSVTDSDGHTTTNTYNRVNEVVGTSNNGSVASYKYDLDGNQTVQGDGLNHSTIYEYTDPAYPHAVTSMTPQTVSGHPAAKTIMSYDNAGRLAVTTDPSSRTTTYSYDVANQLTSVDYSDSATPDVSNIHYDPDGRRTGLTDGTGTSTWAWDSLGRMTSSKIGAAGTVQYGYDIGDNLTTIAYPGAGTVTRTPDDDGRVFAISDWQSHGWLFGYDQNSNLTGEFSGNGVNTASTFQNNDNIASVVQTKGSTTLAGTAYGRTAMGLDNAHLTVGTAEPSHTFSYDSRDRLATDSRTTTSYTYDLANRLTRFADGTNQAFNEADELCWSGPTSGSSCSSTPSGDTSYTYDQQGNRTLKTPPAGTATAYSYDQADRLTSFGPSGGSTTATYTYSADNLRTAKIVGSTTTNFTWDQADPIPLLLQETTGTTTTNYVYGPTGTPLEQLVGTTATFVGHDQLGSTRLLTDSAGNVSATYAYDPYGRIPSGWKTGTASTPFQFAGQYTDPESGLQYLRARYYDPTTAQFVTRDPAVSSTREPYAYANGGPLNVSDPSGLFWGEGTLGDIGDDLSDGWDATGGKVVHGVAEGGAVVASTAVSVGHFVVTHRGALADIGAGLVCVGSVGTGCLAAVGAAAAIGAEQVAQDDIGRGASIGSTFQDVGVSVFKSGALAIPGLAEYEEALAGGEAAAFFERYPFISTEGWEAPSWFSRGFAIVNGTIFTLPSSLEIYRAIAEGRC